MRIAALTIECRDLDELARFYAAALAGRITHRNQDSSVVSVTGLTLVVHADPTYEAPTWPLPDVGMQMHLEFHADDPEAAVRRLCSLGASVPTDQPLADEGLTIVLDPAGHPLCVFAP
jgi:catechol-2,3-dioxygenase